MGKGNEGEKPTHLSAQKRVLKCFNMPRGLTIHEANSRLLRYGLIMEELTLMPTSWIEISARIPDGWTPPQKEGIDLWMWATQAIQMVTRPLHKVTPT